MMIVLRVGSPELDLDACLAWIPPQALQRSWRAGDLRPGGKRSPRTGFNLLLAHTDDTGRALLLAEKRFEALAPHLEALVKSGAGVEVDIGIAVADLPRSVRVPKEFTAKMARVGAEVVVTAYPSLDESDEDE